MRFGGTNPLSREQVRAYIQPGFKPSVCCCLRNILTGKLNAFSHSGRKAIADTELAGFSIPAGQALWVGLSSVIK